MRSGLYLRMFNSLDGAGDCMRGIGVCPEAIDIMLPKMRHFVFMVRALDPRAANILKQEMLSVGGEAAISYSTICDLSKPTDCLLSGTERQLRIAVGKLERQPFGLKALAAELGRAMDNIGLATTRRVGPLELGRRTIVMGILNLAGDSFSGDGISDPGKAAERALEMEREGARIIDIGGESTRPGAAKVGTDGELARVMPVIGALKGKLRIPMSIDSRDPDVIEAAVREGAGMVNLVGGIRDPGMAKLLARLNVPVVLMHMQGEPGNMQLDPRYADVMDDIVSELRDQIAVALESGVSRDSIILDPGIGFGKTAEHNLEILRRLDELRILGLPVMIGASRKSFIGKVLDAEVGDRLEGSISAAVLAASRGADIVRVHDILRTVKAMNVADAILTTNRVECNSQ